VRDVQHTKSHTFAQLVASNTPNEAVSAKTARKWLHWNHLERLWGN